MFLGRSSVSTSVRAFVRPCVHNYLLKCTFKDEWREFVLTELSQAAVSPILQMLHGELSQATVTLTAAALVRGEQTSSSSSSSWSVIQYDRMRVTLTQLTTSP